MIFQEILLFDSLLEKKQKITTKPLSEELIPTNLIAEWNLLSYIRQQVAAVIESFAWSITYWQIKL